jgi:hypothetical protein
VCGSLLIPCQQRKSKLVDPANTIEDLRKCVAKILGRDMAELALRQLIGFLEVSASKLGEDFNDLLTELLLNRLGGAPPRRPDGQRGLRVAGPG